MKSVVADLSRYDWEGDQPLQRPFAQTIIYELHVGGFTKHPSSGVAPEKRGTFAGLMEKIPYLTDLGVTAVELLPVFQFDVQDCPPGLVNYWGYSPVSFFAPHQGYGSRKDPLAVLDEFRDLVKALHRAGIEVILDVVFNHTAEGNHLGPTLCFRGLANEVYYLLEPDRSLYADYSGPLRQQAAERHSGGFHGCGSGCRGQCRASPLCLFGWAGSGPAASAHDECHQWRQACRKQPGFPGIHDHAGGGPQLR